jgi:hypothetical protein
MTTPARPIEEYGESKLEAEQAVAEGWQRQDGLTILRPRTILGNGRQGIIGTLGRWIEAGVVLPLPSGGRHALQLVHVEDLARMIAHIIENAVDGVWPVGAPNVGRFDTELRDLITRTGSRSRILPIPGPLFRAAAWAADRSGLSPFTRWHYGSLGHDFAFDPTWVPAGFAYIHDNESVLASVVAAGAETKEGSSAHTRAWKTRPLDRIVTALTAVLGIGRPARQPSEDADTTRRRRPLGETLLRPLVRHPRAEVEQAAITSLRHQQEAAGKLLGMGLLVAAQVSRLEGNPIAKWPILRGVLAPLLDLTRKLGAAHLGAALGEPSPLPRSQNSRWGGNVTAKRADMLVIGSGPGAAMAALAAAETGAESIVVLEAGTQSSTPSERHHSLEHVINDFAGGGLEMCIANPPTQITQGRVIGGGSEVNSGFYHDLPERHRQTWCLLLGIEESEWLAAETEIRDILELTTEGAGDGESVIRRGAEQLDIPHMLIPRWRTYTNAGFSQHGMTRQVWAQYPDIALYGGKHVTRLEYSSAGIVAHTRDGERVLAERVAIGAGPVSTPRILENSGLITRGELMFNLHPMIRIVARCNRDDAGRRDVDPYQAFSPDGYKYGGAVSTPSLLGAALGQALEESHAGALRSYYASFEPSGCGGFLPTPLGLNPYYRYSSADLTRLLEAADKLHQLLLAAGVRPITDPLQASKSPSSVHLFGSVPLGNSALLSASSQLARDPRIAIYDASLLPTAPGVNPQGPVMTLALLLARRQMRSN